MKNNWAAKGRLKTNISDGLFESNKRLSYKSGSLTHNAASVASDAKPMTIITFKKKTDMITSVC